MAQPTPTPINTAELVDYVYDNPLLLYSCRFIMQVNPRPVAALENLLRSHVPESVAPQIDWENAAVEIAGRPIPISGDNE